MGKEKLMQTISNIAYAPGVTFNKRTEFFTHKNDVIFSGDIVEPGEYSFYAPPFTLANSEEGKIALATMEKSDETYIGRKPDGNGGYLFHYAAKSLRVVRNENHEVVEMNPTWHVGDITNYGEIVEIADNLVAVRQDGRIYPVKKSLLRPPQLNSEEAVDKYLTAVKIYKSLRSEIRENREQIYTRRLEKSFFNAFKKAFKPKAAKTTELPPETGGQSMDTPGAGHTLQHIHFDMTSPTRKTFTYKSPTGQQYTSPHYLNQQGQKALEPDHVKNFKIYAPGQSVIHQGQPHTVHQVGRQNIAVKDAQGKIKVVDTKSIAENAAHSFNPMKEPIVKSYALPDATKFDFHKAKLPAGEHKFLKDVKEGHYVEFPESHPEAEMYKQKFNTNLARVSRINPVSGKMLLSSPITTKDYKLYTAESQHFNKASDKLQEEHGNISKNIKPDNHPAHEYLSSLKTQASANQSTLAEEIAKERQKLDAIKADFNTGKGRNLQELADAVKKQKILDEFQGVKKVFPANQQYIIPGMKQHDEFLQKAEDVEKQGIKKTGAGSDYRVPFKHDMFDFELTINPISGNINSNIKNAQKFKIGNKDAEVIHYNPLQHKVSVKVGKEDTPQVMTLEELNKLKRPEQMSSVFARNKEEYENPIAGEKENYGKGSFQHKEFGQVAESLKQNSDLKHIAQESGDFEQSFHHDQFGRFKLKYNDKTGQKQIEITEPKEFKIGGSTYIPTAIDPVSGKVSFHQAGQSWKKKTNTADMADLVNDIKTTEKLRSQPKKNRMAEAVEETAQQKKAKVNDASEKFKNKLFGDMHETSGGGEYTPEKVEEYLKSVNSSEDKSHLSDAGLKKAMDSVHSEINESNPHEKVLDLFGGKHEKLIEEYNKFSGNKADRDKLEKEKAEADARSVKERGKAIEQSQDFKQNSKYVDNYKKLPYLHEKEHTIQGKKTKLRLKDAEFDKKEAQFHIINLDDAIPSHIPSHKNQPFEKNPAYPAGVQAKSYHENNETASSFRKLVHSVSKDFNPEEVLNAGIQGNDNTPVADKKGIILGGNTRTMGSKLHDEANTEKRRQEIINKIDDFVETKSPEERAALIEKVKKNPNPFVLRVVDHDLSANDDKNPESVNENFGNYNRLSAVLNSSQNAEISNEDKKKTNIQKVADLIPNIANVIGGKQTTQLGAEDTASIRRHLAGRLKEDEMAKYFQGNTLTEDGHSFVRGILSANAIENTKTRKTLEKHPQGTTIINNINNAPMWNQIQNITKEPQNQVYSLQRDLDKTIAELNDRSKNRKQEAVTEAMFETPVRQRVLYNVLSDESGEKLKDFTDSYHSFIKKQSEASETESMFAEATPEEMIDRFYQRYERENPSQLHLDKLKAANKNKSISNLFKKKPASNLKVTKEGIKKAEESTARSQRILKNAGKEGPNIPTLEEYKKQHDEKWKPGIKDQKGYLDVVKKDHRKILLNAYKQGHDLTDEHLKDHPDLAKKIKDKLISRKKS